MHQVAKAMWNGAVIAQSDQFEIVEGNIYFPPSTVREEYLRPSTHTTHCPWKGDAHYFTLSVDGKENGDAAWYYPEPFEKVRHIKDHIAFWKGVDVSR